MKAILNADLYDFHAYKTSQYILCQGSRIAAVGPMARYPAGAEVSETFDAKGALVMPGLIIGHAHLYSAFVRGLRLPFQPGTFTQLLRQLWWRMDAAIDPETAYHSARVYGVEHLRNGVTTIFDHHAGGSVRGSLAALKLGFTDELGLRALYCFETSDRFDVATCIEENAAFARCNRGPFCRGLFGLHASLSLSQKTLERVAAAQGDVPVHVHVGESLEDEVACQNEYGMRIVQRLDSFGLLKPDSILAHCVNIDGEEAARIAARGCVAAVNPTSNLNTAVGLPDVPMLKAHGVPVMVGNDSLGSNITRCYQNLLYTMHHRSGSAWRFGYDDVLACIRTGYDYAGRMLGVRLGRLAPGYEADLIAVPYRAPVPVDGANAFAFVMDGVFPQFHPRDVMVGGAWKMRGYETVFDEEEIYAKARAHVQQYWKRIDGWEESKWISAQEPQG